MHKSDSGPKQILLFDGSSARSCSHAVSVSQHKPKQPSTHKNPLLVVAFGSLLAGLLFSFATTVIGPRLGLMPATLTLAQANDEGLEQNPAPESCDPTSCVGSGGSCKPCPEGFAGQDPCHCTCFSTTQPGVTENPGCNWPPSNPTPSPGVSCEGDCPGAQVCHFNQCMNCSDVPIEHCGSHIKCAVVNGQCVNNIATPTPGSGNCNYAISFSGSPGQMCSQASGASVTIIATIPNNQTCPNPIRVDYNQTIAHCAGENWASCDGACGAGATPEHFIIPADQNSASYTVNCTVPNQCGSCQVDINNWGKRAWNSEGCAPSATPIPPPTLTPTPTHTPIPTVPPSHTPTPSPTTFFGTFIGCQTNANSLQPPPNTVYSGGDITWQFLTMTNPSQPDEATFYVNYRTDPIANNECPNDPQGGAGNCYKGPFSNLNVLPIRFTPTVTAGDTGVFTQIRRHLVIPADDYNRYICDVDPTGATSGIWLKEWPPGSGHTIQLGASEYPPGYGPCINNCVGAWTVQAATATPTPTFTQTPSPTATHTPTLTVSPTPTSSGTPTPTVTPTGTQSPTTTPPRTPTPTATAMLTQTPTSTPTRTPSPTPVPRCNSICREDAECPSNLFCYFGEDNDVRTGFCRLKENPTDVNCRPVPTSTPTTTPTRTPTVTPTTTPSRTPTPTSTLTPTAQPSSSLTPTATLTHTPTLSPTHTPTNTPTHTPTATPTGTGVPAATHTPTPTPTPIVKTVVIYRDGKPIEPHRPIDTGLNAGEAVASLSMIFSGLGWYLKTKFF